jgi:hypothetical protein
LECLADQWQEMANDEQCWSQMQSSKDSRMSTSTTRKWVAPMYISFVSVSINIIFYVVCTPLI